MNLLVGAQHAAPLACPGVRFSQPLSHVSCYACMLLDESLQESAVSFQFGPSARKTNFATEPPQAIVGPRGRNKLQPDAHRLRDSFAARFLRLFQQLFQYFHGDFSCRSDRGSVCHTQNRAFCYFATIGAISSTRHSQAMIAGNGKLPRLSRCFPDGFINRMWPLCLFRVWRQPPSLVHL